MAKVRAVMIVEWETDTPEGIKGNESLAAFDAMWDGAATYQVTEITVDGAPLTPVVGPDPRD